MAGKHFKTTAMMNFFGVTSTEHCLAPFVLREKWNHKEKKEEMEKKKEEKRKKNFRY